MEKGRSSQNPSPQAATHVMKEARPAVTPRISTMSVRNHAIVKVPGTQRWVQFVRRVAARANRACIGMAAAR